MDNFTKNEIKGRMVWAYYLANHGVKKNTFSENKYCHYDGTLTGLTDITAIYELKYRDIPTDTYEEWMIEEKKAVPLKDSAIISGYDRCLYIVITMDDILVWDILPTALTYQTQYCTKTTAEDYHKGEIPKSVAFLNIKDTICKIKRKDGLRLLLS